MGDKPLGFFKRGWAEFRDFAFKGNLIDLAVAVVIGGAFNKVIGSVVDDIVKPAIEFVQNHLGAGGTAGVLPPAYAHINNFIGALLNFFIVALTIFIIFVKVIGSLMKKSEPSTAPSEPTTKECPYCLSAIPIKATRCAHCTSELGGQ